MPAAEVVIDVRLVRRLLAEQHPDLAGLTLRLLANGWDNVVYRLGDELCIRLPRRQAAAVLIEHEQRWLPAIAGRLSLPIPAPVRVGCPGSGYPWPWSVTPYFDGRTAAEQPPSDEAAAIDTLATFITELHIDAPGDAPPNPFRGVPLIDRDDVFRQRVRQLAGLVDGPAALAVWDDGLAAPVWTGPPQWLHGDLHSHNLIVGGGRITAVIDFGDITAGDPATDMYGAWTFAAPAGRERFRQVLDIDDATWARARGWAVGLGVAIVASSADNPLMAAVGERTLAAALEHDGPAVVR